MWLVWGQGTVPLKKGEPLWTYKGEGSPTNRVVSAFLTWDGSRRLLGYHDGARTPLQKQEQFHSKLPPILNPQHLSGRWEMLLWTLGTSWQPFLHCHCPSGQAHRRLGSIGSEGMPRYADVPPFQPPQRPQGNVAFATERSFQQREDKARRQPAEDEVWGRRRRADRGADGPFIWVLENPVSAPS